jgi:hypothetical protein
VDVQRNRYDVQRRVRRCEATNRNRTNGDILDVLTDADGRNRRPPTSQGEESSMSIEALRDEDRSAAEAALLNAERRPVLSGPQACAVAQVHALLAIERRLDQLCTGLAIALHKQVDPVGARRTTGPA